MGLITGLLGLPLAPLRGTVAVAEQVQRQAEEEFYDPATHPRAARGGRPAARSRRADRRGGRRWEDELVERLMVGRTRPREGVTDGDEQSRVRRRRPRTKKTAAKKSARQEDAAKKTPRREKRAARRPRARAARRSGRPRSQVAAQAARQLLELTGKGAEGVTGLERTDDGWKVQVEVVEVRRIPDTTDVLALYEVQVDEDGDLRATGGCAATRAACPGRTEMTEASDAGAHVAAVRRTGRRARPCGRRAAGEPRRHPGAGARQGHHHRRRHPGEPARHRAAHDQDPAADRLGRQGQGDGHRLVAQRPDAEHAASRGSPTRTAELRERVEELELESGRGARSVADQVTGHDAGHVVGQGRYLYAISRGLDPAALADVPGLGGRPAGRARAPRPVGGGQRRRPRGVRRGGAAPQPRGPRVAGGGRPRVTTRWCTRSPSTAPVAPLRLATICLGRRRRASPDRRVARRARAGARPGRGPPRVEREGVRRPGPPRPGRPSPRRRPSGGAAYLQRKKAETPAPRAGARSSAAQVAEEVHAAPVGRQRGEPPAAAPGPAADRARRADDPQRRLPRGRRPTARSSRRPFVRRTTDAPRRRRSSGRPWPPYSFAMLEQR